MKQLILGLLLLAFACVALAGLITYAYAVADRVIVSPSELSAQ